MIDKPFSYINNRLRLNVGNVWFTVNQYEKETLSFSTTIDLVCLFDREEIRWTTILMQTKDWLHLFSFKVLHILLLCEKVHREKKNKRKKAGVFYIHPLIFYCLCLQ